MKSPFPGMDPYLEQYWGDVHTSFIVYARNQINPQLPDDLQARVEEGIAVQADDPPRRTVYPDVSVAEPQSVRETAAATVAVPVAEPCVLRDEEPRTQRHIEIVNLRDGGRVVTAIEVLSPANKVGQAGQSAYPRKQRDYLDAGINLVEIDLVRDGDFILAAAEHRIPPDYRTPYLVCTRRADQPGQVEIYRVPLREPLPNIPVPLRPSDRDVVLQLQPLIDDCYRDGRYDRIQYGEQPLPRLAEDDARWADILLREKGCRA